MCQYGPNASQPVGSLGADMGVSQQVTKSLPAPTINAGSLSAPTINAGAQQGSSRPAPPDMLKLLLDMMGIKR